MRQALKSDRARTDVSNISPFGLMELVRQRLGSSAISVSTEPCPCCGQYAYFFNVRREDLTLIDETASV